MSFKSIVLRLNLILISLLLTCTSALYAHVISGNLILERQSDHSGASVLFTAISPTAVTTTVSTKSDGMYIANLPGGVYDITWSKNGFTSVMASSILFTQDSLFDDITLEYVIGAIFLDGFVSGTLYKDSFYLVDNFFEVAEGQSLYIEPGAEIGFSEGAKFTVRGELIAQGTESEKIVFKNRSQNHFWSGISFIEADSFQTISHCIFRLANSYLRMNQTNFMTIEYCDFENVTAGIRTEYTSGTIIRHNTFIHTPWWGHAGSAISFNFTSLIGHLIEYNEIHGFNSGIGVGAGDNLVQYNWIDNCNWGLGIGSGVAKYNVINGCSVKGLRVSGNVDSVINNTVYNCEDGLTLYNSADSGYIAMNLITHNNTGVIFDRNNVNFNHNLSSKNEVNYSGAPVGIGVPIDTNSNGHKIDAYFNLLDVPPVYYSKEVNDDSFLFLRVESPCIDTGEPLLRDEDGTIRDIGANPYVTWVGIGDPVAEVTFNLFPNPNSGSFILQMGDLFNGKIQILGISGNVVHEDHIDNKFQHEISSELNPGIYFLKLTSVNHTGKTEKFIVR